MNCLSYVLGTTLAGFRITGRRRRTTKQEEDSECGTNDIWRRRSAIQFSTHRTRVTEHVLLACPTRIAPGLSQLVF